MLLCCLAQTGQDPHWPGCVWCSWVESSFPSDGSSLPTFSLPSTAATFQLSNDFSSSLQPPWSLPASLLSVGLLQSIFCRGLWMWFNIKKQPRWTQPLFSRTRAPPPNISANSQAKSLYFGLRTPALFSKQFFSRLENERASSFLCGFTSALHKSPLRKKDSEFKLGPDNYIDLKDIHQL